MLLVLASAAMAGPQPTPVERGRLLAQRACAMCHSIGPSGFSPNFAAPPFRNLRAGYRLDDLAKPLAAGAIPRHPALPKGRLTPAEAQDLIAYLKTVRRS